ncbi:hypothetical protein L208DRAFT_1543798 [Tricholoma matsutake]|nr:hypothetical protein L208DRAFT_1543798 [Tricholoma matsutake 945]
MFSSSDSDSEYIVPDDHVALVLLEDKGSSFYLQVPLNTIHALCLKALKYLLYLGWCILSAEGVLSLERDDHDGIDTDEDAVGGEIYYYVPAAPLDLAQVVDLDVIKARTDTPSESSATRDDFRTVLEERDVRCVWTGSVFGDSLHIIPFKRGSEWFRLIVENRTSYDEDVATLVDINDIRNGVLANTTIHRTFDRRHPQDIPPRYNRTNLASDVGYPPHRRYTLQWLKDPGLADMDMVPNNSDATFKKATKKAKPSDLLLHYTYGAATVKCWGRGTEILTKLANPPRPQVPVPAPAGPQRTIHDRAATIRMRSQGQSTGETGAGSSTAGAGTGGFVESEGRAIWDEDEVMLFFWGNSEAAKERHLKKVGENTRRLEQWRGGVAQVSV